MLRPPPAPLPPYSDLLQTLTNPRVEGRPVAEEPCAHPQPKGGENAVEVNPTATLAATVLPSHQALLLGPAFGSLEHSACVIQQVGSFEVRGTGRRYAFFWRAPKLILRLMAFFLLPWVEG